MQPERCGRDLDACAGAHLGFGVVGQGLNLLLFAERRFGQRGGQGDGQGGGQEAWLGGRLQAPLTLGSPRPQHFCACLEPSCLPACLPACLSVVSAWHCSGNTPLHSTPPHYSLDGDGTPHAPCPQTCGQRHFGIHRLNCDFCDQRRAEQSRAENRRADRAAPARTSRQCRTVGPVRIRCLQLLPHWTGLLPHHTRWTSPLPTVLYVSRRK